MQCAHRPFRRRFGLEDVALTVWPAKFGMGSSHLPQLPAP